MNASTALSVVLLVSLPKSGLESSLNTLKYKAVDPNKNVPYCYVETNKRKTFDLNRLCKYVPPVLPAAGGQLKAGGSNLDKSSNTGVRVCNTPSDISKHSSPCGGTASKKKVGR